MLRIWTEITQFHLDKSDQVAVEHDKCYSECEISVNVVWGQKNSTHFYPVFQNARIFSSNKQFGMR